MAKLLSFFFKKNCWFFFFWFFVFGCHSDWKWNLALWAQIICIKKCVKLQTQISFLTNTVTNVNAMFTDTPNLATASSWRLVRWAARRSRRGNVILLAVIILTSVFHLHPLLSILFDTCQKWIGVESHLASITSMISSISQKKTEHRRHLLYPLPDLCFLPVTKYCTSLRKTAHFALCLQPPGKELRFSLKLTGCYTFHICYMELWSLLGH